MSARDPPLKQREEEAKAAAMEEAGEGKKGEEADVK